MSIEEAFENFMKSGFESAVDASTREFWRGDSYSVELFEDGTYRVLWSEEIGNRYDSPGLILVVPVLDDDDWNEDKSIRYYGNAEDAMRDKFKEVLTVA